MEQLKNQIRNCTKCPALVKSRRQAVPGDGAAQAKILFVGLAPGRLGADITGIPFTKDRSGLLFREMLEVAGLDEVFVTNIVKCNPQDTQGRNRNPSAEEIENCSRLLEAELSMLSPKIIVPFGRQAIEYFLGKTGNLSKIVLQKYKLNGYKIIPMYHPSYVIRGSYKREYYIDNFTELKNII